MELSATAKAILGILAMGPRSGYEIKQLVDRSTRFFWAASYGQIYPELKRLTEAGLVKGRDASTGGRQRTVHELTGAGEAALREWHGSPAGVYELRDEGLLKIFFAAALGEARTPELLRQRREHSDEVVTQLRRVEEALEGASDSTCTVLRFGIEMNEWIADWCERTAAELETKPKEKS